MGQRLVDRMRPIQAACYAVFATTGYFAGDVMTGEERLNQHIETIARWIVGSEHIVAFTGAGISTDSGIPDFRGPKGVGTRRDAGLPPPRWRVPPGQLGPDAAPPPLRPP